MDFRCLLTASLEAADSFSYSACGICGTETFRPADVVPFTFIDSRTFFHPFLRRGFIFSSLTIRRKSSAISALPVVAWTKRISHSRCMFSSTSKSESHEPNWDIVDNRERMC